MKKWTLLQCVVFACMLILSGLYFAGCNKSDFVVDQPIVDSGVLTKATSPDGHWRCAGRPDKGEFCGFLNPGWKSKCGLCGVEYSASHGGLMVQFFSTFLSHSVGEAGGYPPEDQIDDNFMANRIILPNGVLPSYAPAPWFDSAKSMTYYNNLKTQLYYSDPAYAEGVEVAWYRTVRMLYPGISILTKVESLHSKWIVSEGRYLKRTSNGLGIMAGTKAAIEAFGNR